MKKTLLLILCICMLLANAVSCNKTIKGLNSFDSEVSDPETSDPDPLSEVSSSDEESSSEEASEESSESSSKSASSKSAASKSSTASKSTASKSTASTAAANTVKANASSPSDLLSKAAAAKQANSDCVGYIYMKNANVSRPVVRYTYKNGDAAKYKEDPNSFYLEHSATRSFSKPGALFLDYRALSNELSKNLVIYGHRQNDGSMFGSLYKYEKLSFFNENPYIDYASLTTNTQMKFKIFAIFYAPTEFNYIQPNPNEGVFKYIVDGAISRSEYITNVDVLPSDTIITLSTCTKRFQNPDSIRLVVMGRMIREGESTDVSPATKNPSPLRPANKILY